jgi:hypothetical protein
MILDAHRQRPGCAAYPVQERAKHAIEMEDIEVRVAAPEQAAALAKPPGNYRGNRCRVRDDASTCLNRLPQFQHPPGPLELIIGFALRRIRSLPEFIGHESGKWLP